MKENRYEIIGYSERGIINSLIFSIGKNRMLMKKFIELINITELNQLGNPLKITILLEQSFSRFGDADLVIIINYENPENKRVLFIEGKVKTFQANKWSLVKQLNKFKNGERYKGYSSNLFFQLHLKKLLIDNWLKIKESGGVLEPMFNDFRKIGNNRIVLKAFDMIACKKAYYIGLIPSSEIEVHEFVAINNPLFHFLTWEKVENFCKENELQEVLKMFEYNKGQVY